MTDGPTSHKWLALSLIAIAIIVLSGSLSGCSGSATEDPQNKANVSDRPPIMYKGSGNHTRGPITLSKGNATINITGDAVEHPTWGAYPWDVDYSYMIANNTTGEWIADELDMIADNRSVDDARSVYARSTVFDVRAAGDYLIKIKAKNETVRWEISISQ
jgi:hypothetical protein